MCVCGHTVILSLSVSATAGESCSTYFSLANCVCRVVYFISCSDVQTFLFGLSCSNFDRKCLTNQSFDFFFFFLLPISNFANMSELPVFELRFLSWKLLYIKHLKYSPAFGQLARPLFEKSLALQLNNRLYTNLRASVLPTYLQPLCNCPPCQ